VDAEEDPSIRGTLVPMRGVDSFELSETLAPEPASVGRARRLIGTAVAAAGDDGLVDLATLLVSEVVTNAVLHAGTEIRLRYRPSATGVHIEVFDRSRLMPNMRHYDEEATTGRGLGLVSALAASWGVRHEDNGKTLWFELDRDRERERPSAPEPAPEAPRPSGPPTFTVRLVGASPALVRATIAHGDALLREVALLAFGGDLDDLLPHGWHMPEIDVSPVLAAAEAASTAGRARADLEFSLPAGAERAGIERLRLLDLAEGLARDNRLLSAPSLPEIAVCRHWIYTQIAEQAAGHRPGRWELPEPLEPSRAAGALPDDEVRRLQALAVATVVADDANRVIFVNEAAGELLGWAPAALVGQRLTVIIPPELREAHLAAFSRLQVTGQPTILGSTVRVPALRRDGTRVAVALTIEALRTGQRTVFRGSIVPIDGGDAP
jgi:PAS domain S-box-containing protein